MIPKRLIFIENEIHSAYMKLLNAEIPIEQWLDSKEYEEVALKLMDLHKYYTEHLPADGRLLLHHKVMQVIWSPTFAMMEDMVYEENMSKRQRLFETWQAIYGYVEAIIEDAQVGEEFGN